MTDAMGSRGPLVEVPSCHPILKAASDTLKGELQRMKAELSLEVEEAKIKAKVRLQHAPKSQEYGALTYVLPS